MIQGSKQEKLMAQYLLGQLSPEEQAKFDDKFLADDAFFQELQIAENELRDAYARGELSDSDRGAFEQRLLKTAQQRQKQAFARTLAGYAEQAAASSPGRHRETLLGTVFGILQARPLLVPAVSAAMIALVVGIVWMAHTNPTQVATPGNQPQTQPQGQEQVASLMLAGNVVRSVGQELPTLTISTAVSQVRLEARVPRNYKSYEPVLQTAEGKKTTGNINAHLESTTRTTTLVILLPARDLPRNDYILTVRGVSPQGRPEIVGEYPFRVITK